MSVVVFLMSWNVDSVATKKPINLRFIGFCLNSIRICPEVQRRRRDSNPRYPFEVYTLSRRAPSTARTLFPDRPLRRTRASGDQTCRKVRKFLKIKNTGGAFARSARTLSLAGRAVPSFPLRTGQHRRAAPFRPRTAARPSAVDAFATGYQPMRTLLQVPKNRSAADRPGVPFRTNRLAAAPARSHRPAQIPRMQ